MREDVRTCVVEAPPEVVWDFLADYRNVVRLVGAGCDAELTSGSHGSPGASYQVTILWEGLRSNFPTELREARRPMTLLYVGDAISSSGAVRFDIETTDPERTRVVATVSLTLSGSVGPLEPFGWALVSRMAERLLTRLDAEVCSRA